MNWRANLTAFRLSFEKECWVAMRGLLDLCNYDWRDRDTDGVHADDAAEYIRITIDEIEKAEKRNLARAEAAEQRVAALEGALTEAREHVVASNRAEGMLDGFGVRKPRASDALLAKIDALTGEPTK